MSWVTIKEASEFFGCSEKTIRRRIKNDEWTVKEEKIGCGKPTIYLKLDNYKLDNSEIKLDNLNLQTGQINQTGQLCYIKLDNSEIKLDNLNLQTGQITDNIYNNNDLSQTGHENAKLDKSEIKLDIVKLDKISDDNDKLDIVKLDIPETPNSIIQINDTPNTLPTAGLSISSGLPALPSENIPDLRPKRRECPEKYKAEAKAKGALAQYVVESTQRRGKAIETAVRLFNDGILFPNYKSILGQISNRTLYRWVGTFLDNKCDWMSLAPGYDVTARGRKVPDEIQNKLLSILLHDNEVRISSAINSVVSYYKLKGEEVSCSYKTMERWCLDWQNTHKPVWTIARKGIKAFRDTVNTSLQRDWSLISVGDVWISDGHTVEVMIIDPETGKPKKHEVIVWFDAASRMPVGASVNITENTQSIQLAFRNAALFTKYLPKCVLIDNGKAYNSKYYRGSGNDDEIEVEMMGMYQRLGILVVNSMPYNARSKHLERWWLSLQEDCERYMNSFTGPNAMDTPANLKRNEKFVRSLHNRDAITVEEFKTIFEFWSLKVYGNRPHRGLNGRTPFEVYNDGNKSIASERYIEPDMLNYMMLAIDRKKVTKDGIRINKLNYYHHTLINYVGHEIRVRWDYWDIRSILCYDLKDNFICQAEMKKLQHPLVHLADDVPLAKAKLEKGIKEIRSIEKAAKTATQEILKRVGKTDLLIDNDNFINAITNETPLIPEPVKEQKLNIEDIISDVKTPDNDKPDKKQDDDFAKIARELADAYGL